MTIDPKLLSGSDLWDYYMIDCKDKEYVSVVSLLPLACGSMEKAEQILTDCEKNSKSLIVLYPGTIPMSTNSMTYIGEVPDGVMYIK